MKEIELNKSEKNRKDGEKGAAMVMVLLISFLLLLVSAGLLIEVSMNSANVTDATAEQQAYNAAESGIQATLNVLRGHTVPSQLLDPSKPANDPDNLIDFKKAVDTSSSNAPGDTSTNARLSRWLGYNYQPVGSSIKDRVILGKDTYNPLTDNAYKISISDPDNTGNLISFNTTGHIDGGGNEWNTGLHPNDVKITYVPASVSNLDVSSGIAATNFGKFVVRVHGTGATLTDDVRFSINVNMTAPYIGTRIIRGYIKAGTITDNSAVNVDYDTGGYILMGSKLLLNDDPLSLNPPNVNSGETSLAGTMTPAEPIRVLVSATGYGPRGAVKTLEAIVQKNFFNGMPAPATLTLVGPPVGFVFNPGSSTNTEYSGDDIASDFTIPPIGTTNNINLQLVNNSVNGLPPHPFNGQVEGTPSNIALELPTWLQSTANLDATIQALENVSRSSGRYFGPGEYVTGGYGDAVNARGITFIDDDAVFGGGDVGGGILVVTGKLTLHGNFTFNGLIVVTGTQGVERSGGGNGYLHGNVVVAPYDPNNLALGFTGPRYDLSGGGNSDVTYNSSALANGLTAVSNFVLGVAEK